MSPQWFERLTLTELRFPPQLPPPAAEVQDHFDKLQSVGVDLGDVHLVLENDGVERLQESWDGLMKAAQTELHAAAGDQQSGSAVRFGRQGR